MKERILQWINEHAGIKRMIEWAKRVSFIGFEGVPIYYVIRFFLEEIRNERLSLHASSVAFYFLLAIFPGMIFLITLIPYLPVQDFQGTMFNALNQVLPQPAYEFIRSALQDILSNTRFDLLSSGFILAFFFSTNGVNALVKSFTRDQPIFRKRSWINRKLTVLKLTAILFLLLIFSVIFIVLGNQLIDWLTETVVSLESWAVGLISFIRWIAILLTIFTAISFIYFYAPATEKKWRFVNIGSTVATLLSVISSLVFSFIVNNYNLYNEIYGSLGTLIAITTWIYINSIALIIGFELNLSVKYQKVVRADKVEARRRRLAKTLHPANEEE